ncbi:DUF6603 domain-containing protein [Streptomyces monomycini]|uniref:DUF6603 domain-containing protein n=1 Tax=Streptomyces monomycini TaxID=371720 RepID=UPI0004AB386A|nr:DUF6603 domain-containing protein [Streptomyces monomycini]
MQANDASCTDEARYGVRGQVILKNSYPADGTFSFFLRNDVVAGLNLRCAPKGWKLLSFPDIDFAFLKDKVSGDRGSLSFLLLAEPDSKGTVIPHASASLEFSVLGKTAQMILQNGATKNTAEFRVLFDAGRPLQQLDHLKNEYPPLREQALGELLRDLTTKPTGWVLQGLSATVAPSRGALLQASAKVGLTGAQWQCLPGITLHSIAGTFVYDVGTGMRLVLEATCSIYGLALTAQVDTEGLLLAALKGPVNQPQQTKDILENTPLKDAALAEIGLQATLGDKAYIFTAALDRSWAIDATDHIELIDVRLALSGKGAGAPEATLAGTLKLGTAATLSACAAYTGGSWSVAASAHDLAFAPVAEWLAKRNVPVPDSVKGLELVELGVIWKQGGTVQLTVQLRFPLEGALVDYRGTFTKKTTWSSTHQLRLTAGLHQLDLQAKIKQGSVLASWQAPTAQGVPAGDLLSACGIQVPALPSAMLPALHSFALYYDRTKHVLVLYVKTDRVRIAFGRLGATVTERRHAVQTSATIPSSMPARLSDLPLLKGHLPPSEDVCVTGLTFESAQLGNGDLKALNEALENINGDPFGNLQRGTAVTATVKVLGETHKLSAGPGSVRTADAEDRAGFPDCAAGASLPASPAAAPADAVTWLNVGKSLGPLRIERVGLGLGSKHLQILFDASLTLAGLTFGVQGLAIKIAMADESVTAGLQGLSLAYRNPAVSIAGAVVNRSGTDPNFDVDLAGMLALTTPKLALAALGGYQHHVPPREYTSVFVFARVGGELGGPPPFVLEGLCGGLGINNTLTIPALEDLGSFPLLAGIHSNQDPGEILAELRERMTPVPGAMWAALGIDFASFRYASCSALLIAEFGPDLVIALLGRCTAAFPLASDPGGLKPFAQAQLDIRAVYQHSKDQLSIAGRLTPQSYLLSADCVLHGGFAFDNWFGASAHPGDFVYTLGGYHPAFKPPAHYPRPAEVGFSWNPGGELAVDGGSYLALTPGAVMAGGHLRAAYQTSGSLGSLSAGFTVQADVLIEWSPFHFEADFTVRAWYRVISSLLFWHGGEMSGEVQFSLDLWGPPTGGNVHIDVWKFSFDVPFGQLRPGKPALSWKEFEAQHHPWLSITPAKGVLPLAAPEPGKPLVVANHDVCFITRSVMPATALTFTATDRDPQSATGSRVDIRPLPDCNNITSTHTVTLRTLDAPLNSPCRHWTDPACPHWTLPPKTKQATWTAQAACAKAPAALWSAQALPPVPEPQQALVAATTGWKITSAPVQRTGGNLAAARKQFEADPVQPGGRCPLAPASSPQGPVARTDTDAYGKVSAQLAGGAGSRRTVREALAPYGLPVTGQDDEDLKRLSRNLNHYLTHPPLLTGTAP